jgi:hypothetical protein
MYPEFILHSVELRVHSVELRVHLVELVVHSVQLGVYSVELGIRSGFMLGYTRDEYRVEGPGRIRYFVRSSVLWSIRPLVVLSPYHFDCIFPSHLWTD